MTKGIKYVVVDNKGLTIAIRNDKKGYAKTYGGDVFNPSIGVDIATKKLRIKELNAGITDSKMYIKDTKAFMDMLAKDLAREEKRLSKMLTFRETVTDELHEILLGLGQD